MTLKPSLTITKLTTIGYWLLFEKFKPLFKNFWVRPCSIVSAELQDCGIIDGQNKELIIDRSKVRQEPEKERQNNQSFQTPSSVQGLHFDRKKDSTLTLQKFGVGTHFISKEHITLVAKPGSNYVGHFTPNSGKVRHFWRTPGILLFSWSWFGQP